MKRPRVGGRRPLSFSRLAIATGSPSRSVYHAPIHGWTTRYGWISVGSIGLTRLEQARSAERSGGAAVSCDVAAGGRSGAADGPASLEKGRSVARNLAASMTTPRNCARVRERGAAAATAATTRRKSSPLRCARSTRSSAMESILSRNSYPHHTASQFPFVPHPTTHAHGSPCASPSHCLSSSSTIPSPIPIGVVVAAFLIDVVVAAVIDAGHRRQRRRRCEDASCTHFDGADDVTDGERSVVSSLLRATSSLLQRVVHRDEAGCHRVVSQRPLFISKDVQHLVPYGAFTSRYVVVGGITTREEWCHRRRRTAPIVGRVRAAARRLSALRRCEAVREVQCGSAICRARSASARSAVRALIRGHLRSQLVDTRTVQLTERPVILVVGVELLRRDASSSAVRDASASAWTCSTTIRRRGPIVGFEVVAAAARLRCPLRTPWLRLRQLLLSSRLLLLQRATSASRSQQRVQLRPEWAVQRGPQRQSMLRRFADAFEAAEEAQPRRHPLDERVRRHLA